MEPTHHDSKKKEENKKKEELDLPDVIVSLIVRKFSFLLVEASEGKDTHSNNE